MGRQWTDNEMLEAVTLRDEGWTMKDIGALLGRSKNSVIGTVNRILNEASGAPTVGNGTMPPRWWQDGLDKRDG